MGFVVSRKPTQHAGQPEPRHGSGTTAAVTRPRSGAALPGSGEALAEDAAHSRHGLRPVKVAVVIDGCFWHCCPDHFVTPKTNRPYPEDKIGRNVQRDRDTDQRLADEGWLVMRFWEHLDPEARAETVIDAVKSRRQAAAGSRRSH